MDHGHGGMTEPMCSMNMLFTWDTTDLCVVFKWWHVRSITSLWVTLLAIVALGSGYEYIRSLSRFVETASLSTTNQPNVSSRGKILRAALYALQVAYSFFLMLIFMTYNGWAMVAVTAGAFLGFYIWGDPSNVRRGMACH